MGKYIPLRALNQNILGIFFFCLKNNLKRLIDYQYCCRIIFCPLINRLIISFQQMNTAGYVQCIPEPLLFFISALFFFFLFLSITVQYDIMLRYFWPYTHLTSTPNTWVFGVWEKAYWVTVILFWLLTIKQMYSSNNGLNRTACTTATRHVAKQVLWLH